MSASEEQSSSKSKRQIRREQAESDGPPVKHKGKHKKEKPWDHEGIDHWAQKPFEKGEMIAPLQEESSFAVLFPRHREGYLKEVWPLVEKHLKVHGITAILDLREGSMTVKTTRKTWDPWAIMSARDVIKLIARSVPLEQAIKIFRDDMFMDIIKIGNITSKERFVKRRLRLIGPNGQTLKAIELLTQCYVLVHGNTVSAMGSPSGLKRVRLIVEDCMRNIHPIYHIKRLMIKRELEKNPEMVGENWDRFLPNFKPKNVQRKVRKVKRKPKNPSVFPPEPTPRKEDIAMESGEYFLTQAEKERKRKREKADKQYEIAKENKAKREQAYVPPKEAKKQKQQAMDVEDNTTDIVSKLKGSTQEKKRKADTDIGDFVLSSKKHKK